MDGAGRFGAIDGHLAVHPASRSRGSVAPKVLTQTLRALERDGVLTRTVYAQVPPRVEYQLTDLGHSLVTPIAAIQEWAESHVSHVLAARKSYDKTIA